ncbi:hypothetical protein EU538_08880 [Candidatus Thorarchaeota archaeon]|nr:MAG: hypothetical protein EU538_08880 [Candidatus Thorarchaeota archaeon]
MGDTTTNPFTPTEIWNDTRVTVREGDEEKQVDAKHYHVRYMVGESEDKRFVDSGENDVASLSDKTLYLVPSIHRIMDEPFHYDVSAVHQISGKDNIEGKVRHLKRNGQCDDHEMIEVTFQSPGVECCAMSKDEADKQRVPLKYLAGYLLGKSDGFLKVALSKTELDSGGAYYESIHIIPEAVVKEWSCLEA